MWKNNFANFLVAQILVEKFLSKNDEDFRAKIFGRKIGIFRINSHEKLVFLLVTEPEILAGNL